MPESIPVTVLVVDDMPQNLLAMQGLLAAHHVRIATAGSGAEALELLLHEDVALALVDVQMPEMDGFALAELMRGAERTRSIPIIFATAASEDRQRTFRGYDAGAVDFLYKPVDPQILKSKVAVFVDLYRQRLALHRRNEELERLLKLNEMMTAVLSHDLRTPLSAIALSAEIVQRVGQPESVQRAGTRIKTSTLRMTQMIDQLLDFSRIRSGTLELAPRAARLDSVCEAVINEQRAAAPGATIECRMQGDMAGRFDPDRLMQVFANLLGNALQHGTPGQPVRVRLDGNDPRHLSAEIVNAGEVPREVQDKLFTPFRSATNSESGGLGLGLYIVQQFVAAHGGTVQGRSQAGEGTTFAFTIPREAQAASS